MSEFLNSLNGWQRLGLLISTLIAVPLFFLGYIDTSPIRTALDVPRSYESLDAQQFADKVYPQAFLNDKDLNNCIKDTVTIQKVDSYSDISAYARIECERKMYSRLNQTLPWAVSVYVVIFGFGYVFAWIIAGFRQGKKTKSQKEQGDEE